MVELKNLSVTYDNDQENTRAIENVNMTIPQGEIAVLIGPSGGGKSTILKVLSGIIKTYEGTAYLKGTGVDPRTSRIGFIPQNYGLLKWKTVKENIFLSAKIKDGRKNIDHVYYNKIISKLGIENLTDRYPSRLSGGQQQRAAIGRAFLLKPDLLLMDEPFSALDEMTKEEVQNLFLEVWKENRVTTLIVTHDITEAMRLGHKIMILSSHPGKITEVIDNPLFGKRDIECCKEYKELKVNILKHFKEG